MSMYGQFKVDDRVKFCKTSDAKLDQITGTIVGCSINWSTAFPWHYIVLLDTPYMDQKAINITEACLEAI